MELEQIGAWGELVGGIAGVFAAVGVMATLFYLARQISESVGLARASQNKGLLDSWEAFNNMIASSPGAAEVLAALATQGAELSPTERVRAYHLCYVVLNICTAAEFSFEHKQISAAEYENHRMAFENTLKAYPGLVAYAVEILQGYPGLRQLTVFASIAGLLSQR